MAFEIGLRLGIHSPLMHPKFYIWKELLCYMSDTVQGKKKTSNKLTQDHASGLNEKFWKSAV